MGLPDSYTIKVGSIPAYFDAMLGAQPPDRFSVRFLERLGFNTTNDRLLIGILKDLGFLTADGAPQQRYFQFLDRARAKQVLADGIREAFSDLFAVNTNAQDLTADEVKNKLRTMYEGKKTDLVIGNIAKTFRALCDYADFSAPVITEPLPPSETPPQPPIDPKIVAVASSMTQEKTRDSFSRLHVSGLQYHINIVLPDTRDQAVYDAIFKSLREHLG